MFTVESEYRSLLPKEKYEITIDSHCPKLIERKSQLDDKGPRGEGSHRLQIYYSAAPLALICL